MNRSLENALNGLLLLLPMATCMAQIPLSNSGNMTLHNGAQMGIYSEFTNNGNLEGMDGSLLGFYGSNTPLVLGSVSITAYDVEIGTLDGDMGVFNRLEARNNVNFVSGHVATTVDPDSGEILVLDANSFYTGASDDSHVIGFMEINGQTEFAFPIGDSEQLRPLLLIARDSNIAASCAYFSEDPGNSASFGSGFNTNSVARDVGEVSRDEFWVLQSDSEVAVTLSWNAQSNLASFVNGLDQLILVGWNLSSNQWVRLSEPTGNGTLEEGMISSSSFVPDQFGAITFASAPLPSDSFIVNNPTLGNYYLSPNGDGVNDFLVFEEIVGQGDNFVVIFNKFGQKVFEMANYTDEFVGESNQSNFVIDAEMGLPEGVYYYIVDLFALNIQYQGFFYLDR